MTGSSSQDAGRDFGNHDRICGNPGIPGRIREVLSARSRRSLEVPEGYSRAAVLVLLTWREGHWHLPLMVRTRAGGPHSGQISFPGGRAEPGDEDAIATAVREACEEFGLAPESLWVLGVMDDERTPTGYVVTPVVACLGRPSERGCGTGEPQFRPDPAEVAEIFSPPLCFFCDPRNVEVQPPITHEGYTYRLYEFVYEGRRIWGLTARIIHTFCDLLLGESGAA